VKVEWLPRALNNLRDQVVYVGQRNLPAARELAGAVKAAAGQIAKFPYSGRKGRVPGTRELVVSRTRLVLVYRVEQDAVVIIRVLHAARRWP
jgi:addiction module RelE/StbE family toxin